jgi:hypothetical protein
MASFEDENWPIYATWSRDHLHALGVASVNFNQFEFSLLAIFAHPFTSAGMPYEDAAKLFGSVSNEKRLEMMQLMFRNPRWDDEVRGHIDHLIEYWSACFQNRNLLMHAHQLPLKRNEALAAVLLGKVDHLKLQKPANKDWSKRIYLRLSLPHLRAVADSNADRMGLRDRSLVCAYDSRRS